MEKSANKPHAVTFFDGLIEELKISAKLAGKHIDVIKHGVRRWPLPDHDDEYSSCARAIFSFVKAHFYTKEGYINTKAVEDYSFYGQYDLTHEVHSFFGAVNPQKQINQGFRILINDAIFFVPAFHEISTE